jgi:hypothetical protein
MDLLMFTKHIYMVRFNLLFFRCGFLICQEKKSVIQFLFFLFCFFHIISKKRKKTSDDFYCLFIHMMYMILFFPLFFVALYIPFDRRTVLLRFRIFWLLLSSSAIHFLYSSIYTFLSLFFFLQFCLVSHTCRYMCVCQLAESSYFMMTMFFFFFYNKTLTDRHKIIHIIKKKKYGINRSI